MFHAKFVRTMNFLCSNLYMFCSVLFCILWLAIYDFSNKTFLLNRSNKYQLFFKCVNYNIVFRYSNQMNITLRFITPYLLNLMHLYIEVNLRMHWYIDTFHLGHEGIYVEDTEFHVGRKTQI